MKKLIVSPITLFSVLLLFCATIISVWPDPITDPNPLYLHQYAFHIGVLIYFMPVATVLPICNLQNELSKKHAGLFYSIRCSRKKYLLSGIIGAVMSGVIIMLAAFCLFFFFVFILSLPKVISFDSSLTTYGYDHWSGLKLYLYSGLIYCLNGIVWPVIAYTVLFCSRNAYAAICFPFIFRTLIGYVSQHLGEDISESFYYLDMGQMKLASGLVENWPLNGMSYLLGYIMIIILLCTGICFYCMNRGKRNE
jgi:hypothetical protein